MRMKSGMLLAAIAAGMAVNAATMEPFPDGARVAFFGDSITRGGEGFARIAAQYRTSFLERDMRFWNVGISGGGFAAANMYFDKWLAPLKPTHVVLAFGVNDTRPLRIDPAADPAKEKARVERECAVFRENYEALLDRIGKLGAKVVARAITPYDEFNTAEECCKPAVGKNDSHRRAAEIIRAIAAERNLPCVDDFGTLSPLLAKGEMVFVPDRVHPNDVGQWHMSKAFLAAQGIEIAPFRKRPQTMADVGLVEWDDAAQRLASLLSADWLLVRDESLDLDAKLAKVRDWLGKHENDPQVNKFMIDMANRFLRDAPREAELREKAELAWRKAQDASRTAKPLKVLMIGNSFSKSVMSETPEIAKAMCCPLDICSMYIPGCTLSNHAEFLGQTNSTPYEITWSYVSPFEGGNPFGDALCKGGNGKGWMSNVRRMLKADDWDVVTVQQGSSHSWLPEKYEPGGTKLLNVVEELAPQAKIYVQQTWSYSPWAKQLTVWKITPDEMYERLDGAYKAFAASHGNLPMIRTGEAVQKYRKELPVKYGETSTGGDVVGNVTFSMENGEVKANGDMIHLNDTGKYLQGLVWVGTLFGMDVSACPYVPEQIVADGAKADLLRRIAAEVVRGR